MINTEKFRNHTEAVGTVINSPCIYCNLHDLPNIYNLSHVYDYAKMPDYYDTFPDTYDSISEPVCATDFMISVSHTINGIEKESFIRCQTTGHLAEWCNDMIREGDKVYVEGMLSPAHTATINVITLQMLCTTLSEDDSDYIHVSLTGRIQKEPHLFLDNPDCPLAAYSLEIEGENPYQHIEIPCTAIGPLCDKVKTDFHEGTYITVHGELHTIRHGETCLHSYNWIHKKSSVNVYQPEVFVTLNCLPHEEKVILKKSFYDKEVSIEKNSSP